MQESAFSFIDLFAGVGGMRLGLESIGGRCVFSCEKDRHARDAYEANFPGSREHPFAEDIVDAVGDDKVPKHDVLAAGFPCQPFSIAGVSKRNALGYPHGFDCPTQGTMFDYIHRVLEHRRPAAFLLENVKNLRSHDGGRTIQSIRERLWALGYATHERVIDARGFVPQHRERLFIIGFREPAADGFEFETLQLPGPDVSPVLRSILHSPGVDHGPEPPYTEGRAIRVNPKYTLSPKLWAYLQAYAEKHRKAGNGFGYGLVEPDDVSRTLSARYYKDGAEILLAQGRGKRPRRLTPREASRLMGFDVPGERGWRLPNSDVQAYRQMGNAVVPQVVSAIAAHMRPWLLASLDQTSPAPQSLVGATQLPLVKGGAAAA
jgi:DNA (cytosine-5)-methyltransferase 1